jgi:hypothetical protein
MECPKRDRYRVTPDERGGWDVKKAGAWYIHARNVGGRAPDNPIPLEYRPPAPE